MTNPISTLTFTDYALATTHLARWSIALELAEMALINGPKLYDVDPTREDLGEALDDLSIDEQRRVMEAAAGQASNEHFGSALIEESHLLVDSRAGVIAFPTNRRAMSRDEARDAYGDNPAKRIGIEGIEAVAA